MAKPKWMGYVDPLVKIVGGIVLATATFLLNTSNDIEKKSNDLKQQEINNSLKFGEFTQLLIQDLIAKDSTHFRSDLSFITLNRTIGDKDTALIGELGARIIQDFYYEAKRQSTQKAAYTISPSAISTVENIVQDRDAVAYEKATGYKQDFFDFLVKSTLNIANAKIDSALTAASSSKANNSNQAKKELKATDPQSITEAISKESWAKLTLVPSHGTVFIQVNKGADSTLNSNSANDLRKKLNDKGFNVPGIEVITKYAFKNMIRYYYDVDKATADNVSQNVKGILNKDIIPQKLTNDKVHSGTIELWVNY